MLNPSAIPLSMLRPLVKLNNFQLNLTFIILFQHDKFKGYPVENPNTHVASFLENCHTINMSGVSKDAIHL